MTGDEQESGLGRELKHEFFLARHPSPVTRHSSRDRTHRVPEFPLCKLHALRRLKICEQHADFNADAAGRVEFAKREFKHPVGAVG